MSCRREEAVREAYEIKFRESRVKRCGKCGKVKSTDCFNKNKAKKDGLQYSCKDCRRAFRRENAEEIAKRALDYYLLNKETLAAKHKVYQTANRESIREKKREYRQSEASKATQAAGQKRYRAKFPEKKKATSAVGRAVESGALIRPTTCSLCGCECKPEAHHWSYMKEHRLDVVWLCGACHNLPYHINPEDMHPSVQAGFKEVVRREDERLVKLLTEKEG